MERLQKRIARCSEFSRRKAEELIIEGKIYVNGEKIHTLGRKVSNTDEISIKNKVLYEPDKVYFLLNKPKGIISSRFDEKNRPVITDLIPDQKDIFPVGRLDFNTTGLIILTNDGTLANGLMHPKNELNKTYIVKIKGENLTKKKIFSLRNGVILNNQKTSHAHIQIIKFSPSKISTIKVIIHEGKNRQIRKMFESINSKVVNLKRTEYTFLTDENLPIGTYRKLKIKEIKKLYGLIK